MGCRLHWAKVHKVEWTGGWFNWNAHQLKKVLDALEISYWDENDGDDYVNFEINIEEWKKLKKICRGITKDEYERPVLSEDYSDDEEGDYPINWGNLIEWVKEVDDTYDNDNDYIKFTWF